MRRDEKKALLKEKIIDAAETVFFEKGYVVATMDDVCKNADISKRTLYIYFLGKDQLIMAVLNRGFDVLKRAFASPQGNDPIDRLNWIVENFIRFSFDYPEYFMLIAQFENQPMDFDERIDPDVEAVYAKANFMFGVLLDCLYDGIAQNRIGRAFDPVNAAIIIWSSLFGLCTTLIKKRHYVKAELNRDPSDVIADALAMVRNALTHHS